MPRRTTIPQQHDISHNFAAVRARVEKLVPGSIVTSRNGTIEVLLPAGCSESHRQEILQDDRIRIARGRSLGLPPIPTIIRIQETQRTQRSQRIHRRERESSMCIVQ